MAVKPWYSRSLTLNAEDTMKVLCICIYLPSLCRQKMIPLSRQDFASADTYCETETQELDKLVRLGICLMIVILESWGYWANVPVVEQASVEHTLVKRT